MGWPLDTIPLTRTCISLIFTACLPATSFFLGFETEIPNLSPVSLSQFVNFSSLIL